MSDTRARGALEALAVFLVALVVYAASPVAQTTDSFWVTYTAASLVQRGDVRLDEYGTALERADGFQVDEIEGHSYYEVPLATSLTAAPMVAVALAVDGDALRAELDRGEVPSIDRYMAAVLAALAVMVVYLFALDAARRRSVAVVVAATFALGTAAWSTASRGMWMNTPAMLAAALTVLLVQRLHRGAPVARAGLLLGLVLGYGVAVRPSDAVLAVGVVIWVLAVRRRAIGWVLGGAAAVGAAMVVADLVLLGSVVPRYVRGGRLAVSSLVPEAIAGNLVSPARGLFVFSPVLLLGIVGLVIRHRRGGLSSLDVLFGAVVGVHVLVVSLFPHWWGGWVYGPRFMVDVLPLLVWFLVPVAEVCLDRSDERLPAVVLRVVAVVFLAGSVWINARGATADATFAWNREPVSVDLDPSRLWDWSDPPFLR